MEVLLVIIEKDGNKYTGRCPNLIGVSVTGKTRDEVENAIIEKIENRLKEISDQHSLPTISIAKGEIKDVIQCVYKFDKTSWSSRKKCVQPSQKDGLCWQHWKKLYSHAIGTKINLDGCPLCGETDQDILRRWESPCSFKIENPNWTEILEEQKKAKQTKRLKDERESRLKSHQKYLRCAAIKRNGKQCASLVERGEYCNLHWKVKNSHKFSRSGNEIYGVCKVCGQRESSDEWLNPSYCPKNKG